MVDVSPPHCPPSHQHGHLHLGLGDRGGQAAQALLPEVPVRLRLRTHPNVFRPRRTPVSV